MLMLTRIHSFPKYSNWWCTPLSILCIGSVIPRDIDLNIAVVVAAAAPDAAAVCRHCFVLPLLVVRLRPGRLVALHLVGIPRLVLEQAGHRAASQPKSASFRAFLLAFSLRLLLSLLQHCVSASRLQARMRNSVAQRLSLFLR